MSKKGGANLPGAGGRSGGKDRGVHPQGHRIQVGRWLGLAWFDLLNSHAGRGGGLHGAIGKRGVGNRQEEGAVRGPDLRRDCVQGVKAVGVRVTKSAAACQTPGPAQSLGADCLGRCFKLRRGSSLGQECPEEELRDLGLLSPSCTWRGDPDGHRSRERTAGPQSQKRGFGRAARLALPSPAHARLAAPRPFSIGSVPPGPQRVK